MSTSIQTPGLPPNASDRIDIIAGTPDVAPVGMMRLKFDNSSRIPQVSVDGAEYRSLPVSETQILTAETDTVTFEVGDTDSEYIRIVGHVVGGSGGTATVDLRPNALTTDQECIFEYQSSPTVVAALSDTILRVGGISPEGDVSGFDLTFFPRRGLGGRPYFAHTFYDQGSGLLFLKAGGRWNAETALTSLVLKASVALSFGIGSRFTMYRG